MLTTSLFGPILPKNLSYVKPIKSLRTTKDTGSLITSNLFEVLIIRQVGPLSSFTRPQTYSALPFY